MGGSRLCWQGGLRRGRWQRAGKIRAAAGGNGDNDAARVEQVHGGDGNAGDEGATSRGAPHE